MKTALLLTDSHDIQRLLSEVLGPNISFVPLNSPSEPSREKFDALFAHWLRLVDSVIVDAASLGESARWAMESLGAMRLQEHQAVVVRATAAQQNLYAAAPGWQFVTDTDTTEQLKQSLNNFFELRDTQARLKRADAVIARQRLTAASASLPALPGSPSQGGMMHTAGISMFNFYRYRDALKSISRVLGQRYDERTLLSEFLRLVRELLGVGKVAIFARGFHSDIFGGRATPAGSQFNICVNAGIGQEVVDYLRLGVDGGIGGYLVRESRILRRAQLADPLALDFDAQAAREFELLGTEVAIPIFDNDQLLGVLTFSGKITGEPLTHEDVELVYHLMADLAQAMRNLHLLNQLEGQKRFMSEMLANVHSGVVVIGQDGRILSLNNRARQLLELTEPDLVGKNVTRLPSRVADVIFEALQTGREIRQREVTLPRVGRPLSVSATRFATSLAGSESDSMAAVGLIEDLTQVKQQQAQARDLADQAFFLRVATRLSHELKNALVSIKNFSQLLPERYNEQDFRDTFHRVVGHDVNRVDQLVNTLSFFAHPLDLVFEEVDLGELIDGCIEAVARDAASKAQATVVRGDQKAADVESDLPVVTFKKIITHKTPRIEADRVRLIQAVEHVMRNAVQATHNGGRLTVSTADVPPVEGADDKASVAMVRIEFQDSGEGIPLENLKRVTEPFVTTRNVGVGLGLTITKKIIERHGGRLEIDSLLGHGTTVTLWLPVKGQMRTEDVMRTATSGSDAAGIDPERKGVLVSTPDTGKVQRVVK